MIKGIFLDLSCCCVVLSHFNCVQFFAAPWTVACQAPLPMEFSRQEYWSGLPCLSPGDFSDPGIKLLSLTLCTGRLGSLPRMWKMTKRTRYLKANILLTEKGKGIQFIHLSLSTLWDNEWVYMKRKVEEQRRGWNDFDSMIKLVQHWEKANAHRCLQQAWNLHGHKERRCWCQLLTQMKTTMHWLVTVLSTSEIKSMSAGIVLTIMKWGWSDCNEYVSREHSETSHCHWNA